MSEENNKIKSEDELIKNKLKFFKDEFVSIRESENDEQLGTVIANFRDVVDRINFSIRKDGMMNNDLQFVAKFIYRPYPRYDGTFTDNERKDFVNRLDQLIFSIDFHIRSPDVLHYKKLKSTEKKKSLISKLFSSKQKDSQTHEDSLEIPIDDFQGIFNVFISHQFVKPDQELALQLRTELRKNKIEGYLADGVKEFFKLIGDKITDAIDKSEYVVAIITEQSQASASLNQELGYALGTKKPIIIMIEKGVQHGVLTYGRETQEFTRNNFDKACQNILKSISNSGMKEKISDKEKKELVEKVYVPCYDEIIKIYPLRNFFSDYTNPWKEMSPSWKLRTESDIKYLFEEYSKQLEIWNKLFRIVEEDFFLNVGEIANSLNIAFERNNRLQKDDSGRGSIRLDGRHTMSTTDWVRKFKYVLFDEDITNQNQLYDQLVKFAKLTHDEHEAWLVRFNDTTDVFRDMMNILPSIREEFDFKLRMKELKSEHLKLKGIIEKLKSALEEKLK